MNIMSNTSMASSAIADKSKTNKNNNKNKSGNNSGNRRRRGGRAARKKRLKDVEDVVVSRNADRMSKGILVPAMIIIILAAKCI